MILHLFSTIASFAGQIQRPETVIKCISEPAAVADKLQLRDWVAPVLTSVGSLFVAWFLFNLQSWRDRKNWIRDQKKAEWNTIMGIATDIARAAVLYGQFSNAYPHVKDTNTKIDLLGSVDVH